MNIHFSQTNEICPGRSSWIRAPVRLFFPGQQARLSRFLSRYRTRDTGNSKLLVSVPSGSANEVEAMETVSELRGLISEYGFDATTVKVDERLTCLVTLKYNLPGVAQLPIVDLGIPPGFEVDPAAFDELREDGLIDRYELTGPQVILYLRRIEQGAPVKFSYRLKAKYPVRAKTPTTTAYRYYQPEEKAEAAPVVLTVSPQ